MLRGLFQRISVNGLALPVNTRWTGTVGKAGNARVPSSLYGRNFAAISPLLWTSVCRSPTMKGRAWFKKGSGTFAGTARRVLRTKVPDPFLNHAA